MLERQGYKAVNYFNDFAADRVNASNDAAPALALAPIAMPSSDADYIKVEFSSDRSTLQLKIPVEGLKDLENQLENTDKPTGSHQVGKFFLETPAC